MTLGEVKGHISFNFKANFKDFYSKLCMCSHKRKIQNISERILILLPGSCPRGGTLGRSNLGRGQKSFNFNYKSQIQRFIFQTLYVFSQKKDTKHIRKDSHSVAWVMPQGWDFGALRVPRWSK